MFLEIARGDGTINKCFDEFDSEHDILISDLLRKCLLDPDFPNPDFFPAIERKELIFRLLKSLCLGGELCQFEDKLEAYLDVAKLLYRELIRFPDIILLKHLRQRLQASRDACH